MSLCAPEISHGLTWVRTRVSAMRVCESAIHLSSTQTFIVHLTENTARHYYKDHPTAAAQVMTVYCDKHINTLCGQSGEF